MLLDLQHSSRTFAASPGSPLSFGGSRLDFASPAKVPGTTQAVPPVSADAKRMGHRAKKDLSIRGLLQMHTGFGIESLYLPGGMLAELNDSSSPSSLPAVAKHVGSQAAAMTAAEQCSEAAGDATTTVQVSMAMAEQATSTCLESKLLEDLYYDSLDTCTAPPGSQAKDPAGRSYLTPSATPCSQVTTLDPLLSVLVTALCSGLSLPAAQHAQLLERAFLLLRNMLAHLWKLEMNTRDQSLTHSGIKVIIFVLAVDAAPSGD